MLMLIGDWWKIEEYALFGVPWCKLFINTQSQRKGNKKSQWMDTEHE